MLIRFCLSLVLLSTSAPIWAADKRSTTMESAPIPVRLNEIKNPEKKIFKKNVLGDDFDKDQYNEIGCLVMKSTESCEHGYTRTAKGEDGRQFAQIGCEDLHSPVSCMQLGDWFGEKDVAQAQANYDKACNLHLPLACSKLIDRARAAAETVSLADLTKLLALAQAWNAELCRSEPAPGALCAKAKPLVEEMKIRSDPVFGECEMSYLAFAPQRPEAHAGVFKGTGKIADLVKLDQCQARCNGWVARAKPTDADDLQFRGQCQFQGKSVGAAMWHSWQLPGTCVHDGHQVGSDDSALYERCHCEGLVHAQVDAVASKLGAVPIAKVSYARRLGAYQFYKCAIGFRFLDDARSSTDPACFKNVSALKTALKNEPRARPFDLDLSQLKCGPKK